MACFRTYPITGSGGVVFTEVSLVVLPNRASTAHISGLLSDLAAHPNLRHLNVSLGYPATASQSESAHQVPVIALPADGPGRWEAIRGAVATRFVTVMTLPRPAVSLTELEAVLRAQLAALRAADLRLAHPLLLTHRASPANLVQAYLDDLTADPTIVTPPISDHLGNLLLHAGRVRVEWLDPAAGSVDITLRLQVANYQFDRPLPWRFRAALLDGDGEIVAESAPVDVSRRRDALGGEHWDLLHTRLALVAVPRGEYRVAVKLAATRPELAGVLPARPHTGSLLSSRTVRMPVLTAQGRRSEVRYLLHTPSHGRAALLRVDHGRGPATVARWRLGLVRSDLSYALRGAGGRRMRVLRLLRLLTKPLVAGQEIWLVGERSDSAADNGLHLFRYLRVHHPQRRVYYVLDANSPMFPLLRRLGNTVAHSSLRHEFLMLHARVLANAHSSHHMLPRHWDRAAYTLRLAWRVGALAVFLQHGVHLSPNAVNRGNTGYDVFLTSARRESDALREVSGYDRQIAEVGLPRFDALRPTPPSRLVLFKATWRRYLPSRVFGTREEHDTFLGSAYERFFTELLHSPRLRALLDAHDYRFVFVPHYNVAPFFADATTASDRISVAAAGGTDLQALIRRCDVFMTDHSSVHFDAAYLGTPVIYARFDREEYETRHAAPSWFDFERDGFGPVTYTLNDALDALEDVLRRGCEREAIYTARVADIFTYRDHDNSRRVVAEIDARLRAQRS